jgi:hypothetical protein
LNRQKRRGLSPEGRERLRQAALAGRPWTHSTGPKTAEGKTRAAANGRARQRGVHSIREVRGLLAGVCELAGQMASLRQELLGRPGRPPPQPGPLL